MSHPAVRPVPRDDLRALEGYHSPQLDVQVRLNTNESPFAPPQEFLDRYSSAIRDAEYHRYPDRGAVALRTGIANSLGQPSERVFAANGSNEVLQTLLLTYGGPGRIALIFEPTYALHTHIARLTSTTVESVPRADDYTIDSNDACARIRAVRPSVVFVCSPNNPTGTVEPQASVVALADAAGEVGAVLVVDEAYGEFADHTALDLISDDRGIVVVRTYSKVWSMAGVRLGFCVGPAWMIDELDKVVLPYHLSTPTQLAGIIALDYQLEMLQRVAALVEERGRMYAALQSTPGVSVVPSGANFLLVRVHGDGHAVWEAMVDRGVLVRDFSRWPGVAECLRITIGTAKENDECVAALLAALDHVGVIS